MLSSDEEDECKQEDESSIITSHLALPGLLASMLSPEHDSYNSELGSDSVELLPLLGTCVTAGARRGARESDPAIGQAKACKATRIALTTDVVIAFPFGAWKTNVRRRDPR